MVCAGAMEDKGETADNDGVNEGGQKVGEAGRLLSDSDGRREKRPCQSPPENESCDGFELNCRSTDAPPARSLLMTALRAYNDMLTVLRAPA